jgi:hypothetical protein
VGEEALEELQACAAENEPLTVAGGTRGREANDEQGTDASSEPGSRPCKSMGDTVSLGGMTVWADGANVSTNTGVEP